MKNTNVFFLLVILLFICGCAKEPDTEKIKGDLIGQRCSFNNNFGGSITWTFESLSEYTNFSILSRSKDNGSIEYIIDMSLNDEGVTYDITAKVVYHKVDGDWKLYDVKAKRKR